MPSQQLQLKHSQDQLLALQPIVKVSRDTLRMQNNSMVYWDWGLEDMSSFY